MIFFVVGWRKDEEIHEIKQSILQTQITCMHIIIFKPFTHYSLSTGKKYHFSPFFTFCQRFFKERIKGSNQTKLSTWYSLKLFNHSRHGRWLKIGSISLQGKRLAIRNSWSKWPAICRACLFHFVLITKRQNLPFIFIIYFTFVFTNHIFSKWIHVTKI